ncbi:MAG: AAA family ATPase [Patescibacteria group bacterium]|nr:AAA family ATPase [Patescibacteria group bacterium]
MPALANLAAAKPLKILYLGDPGSGKTGSLDALAPKYKLRIIDFDNLLESLFQFVRRNHPESIGNVEYMTFTDNLSIPQTPIMNFGGSANTVPFYKGTPIAFINAIKATDKWEDGSVPAEWDTSYVLVVDSLSSMSQAAFRYAWSMDPMVKDKRQVYRNAQQLVLNAVQLLGSERFKCNVIMIAHIDYSTNEMNLTKGFARTVGSALRDQIADKFNCVLMATSTGTGNNMRREIRTVSTGIVDLKNPVSFAVKDPLPLETGLLEFFQAVRPN